MHNRLDSLDKIGEYDGPLLQVHGENDKTVPLMQGKRLFAAANEPKLFWEISGDHNEFLEDGRARYLEGLDRFLGNIETARAQRHSEEKMEDRQ